MKGLSVGNTMKSLPYSARQKWLHWLSAVVILWALLSGFYVAVFSVPASIKAWVGFFNVSLTALYIPVFVFRVYCSFAHGLDFSIKRPAQEYLALLVHKAMYGVLAVVLVTGVLMMDRPINIFDLVSIAQFESDPARIAWYTRVHVLACGVLLVMVTLHIGAVVIHERRGKRVMARMLFKMSPETSGRRSRRQLRQPQCHQQRTNQQRDNEPANPVPPGKVPEESTRRTGNT